MVDSTARGLRADASRNRDQLLEVATRAFASAESGDPGALSMRAIAREAGVGIATLYRHFPTRESLVEAVYHGQVDGLTNGARDLLAEYPPAEALRRWMDLFGTWLAAKKGMLDTLMSMIESGELPHDQTRTVLIAAIASILDAGRAAGQLRTDVTPDDIAAGLIGIFTAAHPARHEARAARLLDIFVDGLRIDRAGGEEHDRGTTSPQA